MTNLDKYTEHIKDYKRYCFCAEFTQPIILKYFNRTCDNTECDHCHMLQMIWANEEYTEPETDWSKIAVDTPILVRNSENDIWHKRYFAKFEDDSVYAWYDGRTSWSSLENNKNSWKYAKLAEGEGE